MFKENRCSFSCSCKKMNQKNRHKRRTTDFVPLVCISPPCIPNPTAELPYAPARCRQNPTLKLPPLSRRLSLRRSRSPWGYPIGGNRSFPLWPLRKGFSRETQSEGFPLNAFFSTLFCRITEKGACGAYTIKKKWRTFFSKKKLPRLSAGQ